MMKSKITCYGVRVACVNVSFLVWLYARCDEVSESVVFILYFDLVMFDE